MIAKRAYQGQVFTVAWTECRQRGRNLAGRRLPVGGGIVAQSNPQLEYEATWHKTAGMLKTQTYSISRSSYSGGPQLVLLCNLVKSEVHGENGAFQ